MPTDFPADFLRRRLVAPARGLTFHVAPGGTDAGKGSAKQPFATLQRARDQIRALKKAGPLPLGGVTIEVHGGEHRVSQTFTLLAADSGTAVSPIIYRAAPGERPVFRGGVRLTKWQPLSDSAALERVPAAARNRVWQCELVENGVAEVLPLKLGGFSSGHGFKTHPAHELFFNGKAMQLARGPNEGFLRIAEVAVKDGTKGYDREGSKVGKFLFAGDRPARWIGESDLLLYGYWFWDWADSYERVASIDAEKRIITLAEPWHTYTPAVLLDGVGNRIAHNRFHDVLSSAMRIEGNDHSIEFNEVFHAVLESDDQGGVDMCANPTYRGNVYRYNYWHHIGNRRGTGEQPKCGQAGIRMADAICGTLVYGNIFERCSAGKIGFAGVQIHGGKDNVIENNVFADCAAAVNCTPWTEQRWRESVGSALDDKGIDRALYLARYPQLAELTDNPNRNYVRRNVILRCGDLLRRAPHNIEATNNLILKEGQVTLKPTNPIYNQPGFDRIPVEKIGLYFDEWRKRLPPRQ